MHWRGAISPETFQRAEPRHSTIQAASRTQDQTSACRSCGVFRVEGEIDGGAAIDATFGPGPPAVTVDDAPDDGQADAGARELGGGLEPLERAEQLVPVGRVKASPVVTHIAADGGIADGRGRELDGGVLAAGGELPGVVKQVLQPGPDQGAGRG